MHKGEQRTHTRGYGETQKKGVWAEHRTILMYVHTVHIYKKIPKTIRFILYNVYFIITSIGTENTHKGVGGIGGAKHNFDARTHSTHTQKDRQKNTKNYNIHTK